MSKRGQITLSRDCDGKLTRNLDISHCRAGFKAYFDVHYNVTRPSNHGIECHWKIRHTVERKIAKLNFDKLLPRILLYLLTEVHL